MKLLIVFAATAFGAHIESEILRNLESSPTTNIMVTFKKARTEQISTRFDALKLQSRNAKLNTLHAMLKDHADIIQADVLSLLKKSERVKKHYTSQLWISAELIVRDVDKEIVEQLRNHPDVESLLAEEFYPLDNSIEEFSYIRQADANITNEPQWGVAEVGADRVWATGNTGQGIVIANIDTGVRHTHEALAGSYRGTATGGHNHNWFAPTQRTAVPSDTNGHGTHVAGTTSGTLNGIGVAPGSQWIACRGCGALLCSNFDLLECGNWVGCPTATDGSNADCSKAANVVNNSWGGGRGNAFFDQVLAAWERLEICAIFAAGNSGPNCDTVNSPSDRVSAISVASTTIDNVISDFSSVGPSIDGRMKPDIACPGSAIISAGHLADNQYRSLSGTSMAAPHAAGIAALIRSQHQDYSAARTRASLVRGVVAIQPSGRTCSGTPDSVRPNHHVGAGRSSAPAAVAPAA